MEDQFKCPACSKKIEKSFQFCPYCGEPMTNLSKEVGKKQDAIAQLKLLLYLVDNVQDEKTLKILEDLVKKCKNSLKK